jgi:electron transfer flavoprotein beta subunit
MDILPNIVVCLKHVVDETELKIDRQNNRLLFENAKTKISDDDKNCVEEAVRLKEKFGGTVTVLSVGEPEAKKSIKEALAMGCDRARLLSDPAFKDADAVRTAQFLASAIKKIDGYDLVLCATVTTDIYSGIVGPALAEFLGVPCIGHVTKLTLEGNKIRAESTLEDGVEILECNFPVLLTLSREINTPRFPTLLQIMNAGKKEIIQWTAKDLGLDSRELQKPSSLEVLSLSVPKSARRKLMIDGNVTEATSKLADILLKEGLIK